MPSQSSKVALRFAFAPRSASSSMSAMQEFKGSESIFHCKIYLGSSCINFAVLSKVLWRKDWCLCMHLSLAAFGGFGRVAGTSFCLACTKKVMSLRWQQASFLGPASHTMTTRGVISAGRRLLGAHPSRSIVPNHVQLRSSPAKDISCSLFQHNVATGQQQRRLLSSGGRDKSVDGKSQHALFEEQMRELQAERDVMFGASSDDEQPGADGNQPPMGMYQSGSSTSNSEMNAPTSGTDASVDDEREQMWETRAKVYGFTSEEYAGWSNAGANHTHDESFMAKVQAAREEQDRMTVDDYTKTKKSRKIPISTKTENSGTFTHLSPSGESVSMVDVGAKAVTTRVAKARTYVIFPPEVVEAFRSHDGSANEMVGPKGPIFSTAKIAGIMAAKRTSDLIPLCHPLPLDKVDIQIRLEGDDGNTAVVECECRVTHKTGVEMEALTGATVAALTIYDMCKAVSHNIEIGNTMLIEKTGGKRTVKEQKLVDA